MLAGVEQTSAINSTLLMGVPPPTWIANTITFAKNAKKQGMERISAPNRSYQDLLRSRPKYLHHNLWNPESLFTPTITEWSKTAVPLPCPSHLELNNPIAHQMIFEHSSLFKIVTPINVNLFEHLLSDHPNPSFVKSVCITEEHGICYGVKRGSVSRSGTSPNPQTPTPNLTPIKNTNHTF